MGMSYLGWAKIGNTPGVAPSELLFCDSTGLDRQVEPILSKANWGAGWRNAASSVAYADNQMYFSGGINFEVQYNSTVWTLLKDWAVNQRAFPASMQISPDGYLNYLYQASSSDPRGGVWCDSLSLRISPDGFIAASVTGKALKRVETVTTDHNYAANLRTNLSLPSSFTNSLLNPSPFNRNPIPGWNARAAINWPNSPGVWQDGSNPYGFIFMEGNVTLNNKVQMIRGCTGDRIPAAMIVGTMEASGDMSLWRDGAIRDPYGDANNPSTFTASNAYVKLYLGGGADPAIALNNVVLSSDRYDMGGQDDRVPRAFGFYGLGDGTLAPCELSPLS
jgi:hypothetical protein